MIRDDIWMRNAWIAAWLMLLVAILWFCFGRPAQSAETYPCPTGAPSCKVITITPQEADTLTQAIFPAALWANRTFTDLVEQWKQKLQQAPAGKVEEAKIEPKKIDKK